jgi:hypothetical protein
MSITDPLFVFGIGILGVVLYQIFVTVRLVKFTGYSIGQKIAQSLLVWLVPVLGAWIVHSVMRMIRAPIAKTDRDFTPQDPQSVG